MPEARGADSAQIRGVARRVAAHLGGRETAETVQQQLLDGHDAAPPLAAARAFLDGGSERRALLDLLTAVGWRRRLLVCEPLPDLGLEAHYWEVHGFSVLRPDQGPTAVDGIVLAQGALPADFGAWAACLPPLGIVFGGRDAEPACVAAGLTPAEPLGEGGRLLYRRLRPVHVVVPVYGAVAYFEQCLAALAATTAHHPLSVAIIDDATPDAAAAARIAAVAAAWPGAYFVRHEENRGFPATANEGMALRPPGHDVVLLNSDAVVTPHWLGKLAEAAWSRPGVATATPLSNWAADLSIPCSLRLADACSAFLQSRSPRAGRLYPEVPSGVGFCLYIRSEALDAVGPLDEAFGLGYGEEVDFCRRAHAEGFLNVLDDRTFVYHHGHRSMDEHGVVRDTTVGSQAADEELLRRHPDLRAAVASFLATGHVRQIADAWAGQIRVYRPKRRPRLWLQLWTDPHRGAGGVESVSQTLVEHLSSVYEVLVSWTDSRRVYLEEPTASLRERHLPQSSWPLPPAAWDGGRLVRDPELVSAWSDMLTRYRVDAVYALHAMGAAPVAMAAAKALGLPVTLAAHDYALLCPDYTLMGPRGHHCGAPDDPDGCRACLASKVELVGDRAPLTRDIRRWRAASGEIVAMADRVEYPSRAAQHQVESVLGPTPAVVIPPWREPPRRAPAEREPERVVVVLGYQGRQKGQALLRELVPALVGRGVGVHFAGTAGHQWPTLENLAGVSFSGPYRPRDVYGRLAAVNPFAVLLPSAYAETFSLTLSEAWLASLPAVVSPFGAPADRVRETGAGAVAASYTVAAFVEAVEAVWRDRRELQQRARRAAAALNSHTAYGAQHLHLQGQLLAIGDGRRPEASAPDSA